MEHIELCELILSQGFRTDSDLAGVEKLAVFSPTHEWLDGKHGDLELLPPIEAGSFLANSQAALRACLIEKWFAKEKWFS